VPFPAISLLVFRGTIDNKASMGETHEILFLQNFANTYEIEIGTAHVKVFLCEFCLIFCLDRRLQNCFKNESKLYGILGKVNCIEKIL
jgi:hypothetical protein